jgi:hypothetical protein
VSSGGQKVLVLGGTTIAIPERTAAMLAGGT